MSTSRRSWPKSGIIGSVHAEYNQQRREGIGTECKDLGTNKKKGAKLAFFGEDSMLTNLKVIHTLRSSRV
jgi:hypothetical protein